VDEIFEDGPAGVTATDRDAVEAIEGDDIALSGLRAADGPTGGGSSEWATHANAAIDIAQRHRSRDIGADLVALDHDAAGRITVDNDTIGRSADYVTRAGGAAADRGVD
jgi:hypothetical protein